MRVSGLEGGQDSAASVGEEEEEGTPSRISGFVKMMDTLKTCSSTDAKKSGCLTVAEATELVEHYNRLYQLEIPTSRVKVSVATTTTYSKGSSECHNYHHLLQGFKRVSPLPPPPTSGFK